jgi:hypothetical protein
MKQRPSSFIKSKNPVKIRFQYNTHPPLKKKIYVILIINNPEEMAKIMKIDGYHPPFIENI